MSLKEFDLSKFDPGELDSLRKVLEQKEVGKSRWELKKLSPRDIKLGNNLRQIDPAHVIRLAESITTQGQLQPCIADRDHSNNIRLWAGQHRYWAIVLCNQLAEKNILRPCPLEVKVYKGHFSPAQVFEIQLSENLQMKMTPAEEAQSIEHLWGLYTNLFGRKQASMSDLARRIGRSRDKVTDALKFVSLEPIVRKLVGYGTLNYSLAVELARIPAEKQLPLAVKIIQYGFDREKAARLIRQSLEEARAIHLFTEVQRASLDRDNHRIAFRTAADWAARDASGYYKRILRIVGLIKEPDRLTMTKTIRDILMSLIQSSQTFRELLRQEAPKLAEQLER